MKPKSQEWVRSEGITVDHLVQLLCSRRVILEHGAQNCIQLDSVPLITTLRDLPFSQFSSSDYSSWCYTQGPFRTSFWLYLCLPWSESLQRVSGRAIYLSTELFSAPSQWLWFEVKERMLHWQCRGNGKASSWRGAPFHPLNWSWNLWSFPKSLACFQAHTFDKAEYRWSSEQPNLVKDVPAHWRRAGTRWLFKVPSNLKHSMILHLLCWL